MKNLQSQQGFTLIELLLVSFLLAMLALATFSTVRGAIQTKETIDKKSETLQSARAVLSMLDKDIRAAFFLRAEDLRWRPARPPANTVYPPAQRPRSVSIFQGKASEIFFSSGSHQRMSADVPENEQHFVTYQLSGSELLRGETSRAVRVEDREDTSKLKQFTLLNNVKTLKFDYYDLKSEKWVETWDTEGSEQMERLPFAVKIQLEYEPDVQSSEKEKETIKISTVVKILEASFR